MCQKTRCEPTFEAFHMQEKDILFVKPRQTPLSLVLLQLTAHYIFVSNCILAVMYIFYCNSYL